MLLWAETSGKYASFDGDTMETADHTPRANHDTQARVRGVVFPGLRKEWTGREGQVQSDVLAKAQVLLY